MKNFKETILSYSDDDTQAALSYIIFFINVHDDKSFIRGDITGALTYKNAEELKMVILKGQPNFVKDNWYAIEAFVDGFTVLHMIREVLE